MLTVFAGIEWMGHPATVCPKSSHALVRCFNDATTRSTHVAGKAKGRAGKGLGRVCKGQGRMGNGLGRIGRGLRRVGKGHGRVGR